VSVPLPADSSRAGRARFEVSTVLILLLYSRTYAKLLLMLIRLLRFFVRLKLPFCVFNVCNTCISSCL
jgi:hypothetical protein